MNVSQVTSAWTIDDVTWSSRPSIAPMVFASLDPNDGEWATFSVQSLVQEWVDGASPPHGVMLWTTTGNGSDYRSTEYSNSSQRPYLEVTFIEP